MVSSLSMSSPATSVISRRLIGTGSPFSKKNFIGLRGSVRLVAFEPEANGDAD